MRSLTMVLIATLLLGCESARSDGLQSESTWARDPLSGDLLFEIEWGKNPYENASVATFRDQSGDVEILLLGSSPPGVEPDAAYFGATFFCKTRRVTEASLDCFHSENDFLPFSEPMGFREPHFVSTGPSEAPPIHTQLPVTPGRMPFFSSGDPGNMWGTFLVRKWAFLEGSIPDRMLLKVGDRVVAEVELEYGDPR